MHLMALGGLWRPHARVAQGGLHAPMRAHEHATSLPAFVPRVLCALTIYTLALFEPLPKAGAQANAPPAASPTSATVNDDAVTLEELDLVALMDLDVTTLATRTRLSANDAPARIMSLSREQLEARGYRYLRDVFQDLPGYQASKNSDPDWGTTLMVRGLPGNNRIVFLLNGQRYSPPGGTPMPLFANLPIAFIRRVEIMYGPGSALYGSDAFSGIVNITTDVPDPTRGVTGGLQYGSYGSVSGTVTAEVPVEDKFTVSVGAHYMASRQANLYEEYPNEFRYGNSGLSIEDINSSQLNPGNFNANESGHDAYVTFRREEFTLRYYQRGSTHSSSFGRNAGGSPIVKMARAEDLSQVVMGTFQQRIGASTLTTLMEYSRYELRPDTQFVSPLLPSQGYYDVNDHRASLSSSFRLDEKLDFHLLDDDLILTVGVAGEDVRVRPQATYDSTFDPTKNPSDQARPIEYNTFAGPGDTPPVNPDGIVENADLNFEGPYTLNTISDINYQVGSVYSQLLWSPLDPLQITLGARYDYSSRFGSRFNPRAAVVYRPIHTASIKLLYGRAYLEPTATQVYAALADSTSVVFPNEDLTPELMDAFELAWTQSAGSLVTFTLGGFFNTVRDNINDSAFTRQYVYVYIDDEDGNRQLQQRKKLQTINAGQTQLYGGEGLITFTLDPIVAQFSASYVDGTQNKRDLRGNLDKTALEGASPLMLKTDITASLLNALTLNARFSYYDAPPLTFNTNEYRYADPGRSFMILDANVRYTLLQRAESAGGQRVALFLRGENLLDQRYKQASGRPGLNPIGSPQPPLQIFAGVEGSLGF